MQNVPPRPLPATCYCRFEGNESRAVPAKLRCTAWRSGTGVVTDSHVQRPLGCVELPPLPSVPSLDTPCTPLRRVAHLPLSHRCRGVVKLAPGCGSFNRRSFAIDFRSSAPRVTLTFGLSTLARRSVDARLGKMPVPKLWVRSARHLTPDQLVFARRGRFHDVRRLRG